MFTVSASQNNSHQQKHGEKQETPGRAANSILTGFARGSWVCLLCVKMNGHIMVILIQLQSLSERLLLSGLLASQRNQLRPQQEPGNVEGRLNMPFFSPRGLGQAFLGLAPAGYPRETRVERQLQRPHGNLRALAVQCVWLCEQGHAQTQIWEAIESPVCFTECVFWGL